VSRLMVFVRRKRTYLLNNHNKVFLASGILIGKKSRMLGFMRYNLWRISCQWHNSLVSKKEMFCNINALNSRRGSNFKRPFWELIYYSGSERMHCIDQEGREESCGMSQTSMFLNLLVKFDLEIKFKKDAYNVWVHFSPKKKNK
jgi:hypothetical protein